MPRPRVPSFRKTMEERHANLLLARFDRITDIGTAEITKRELLRWYKQERLTVPVWRDVYDRWKQHQDAEDDKDVTPLLIGDEGGVWILVWGEGLTVSDDAWLQDIRSYARYDQESDDDDIG